jgi:hypothetical protein
MVSRKPVPAKNVLPQSRAKTWAALRPLLSSGRRVLMTAEVYELLQPAPAWLGKAAGIIVTDVPSYRFEPRRGDVLVQAGSTPYLPDNAGSAATVVRVDHNGVTTSTLAELLARERAAYRSLGMSTRGSTRNYRRVTALQHSWRLDGGTPTSLVKDLEGMGFQLVRQLGTAPWRRGGVDTEAIAFLNGGISTASKDGFVVGGLDGCTVVGGAAMAWVCDHAKFRRPATASLMAAAELDELLVAQSGLGDEVLAQASRRLLAATIPELVDAERHVPQLLGWS